MRFQVSVGFCIFATIAFSTAAHAQSYPPAWNPANAYVTGDQVQVAHNVYRAIANAKAGLNPTTDYVHWELANVRYSLTLLIGAGQTFPTFESAWQYALNATIGQSALLKLNIVTTGGNFNDSPTKPISLDHPFGSRIAIGGDNPAKIDFDFESSNGFVIDGGHSLASLSGISITNMGNHFIGLTASSGATLPSITNMNFQGFFDAYTNATSGGLMVFTGPNQFHGNFSTLIQADGGTIYLPSNTSLGGGGASHYGIYATNGAQVFLGSGSTVNNFKVSGVFADGSSFVHVDHCTFSANFVDIFASHSSSVSEVGSGASTISVDASSFVFAS